MKILKEYKDVCGNLLWENDLQPISKKLLIKHMKDKFEFVSPFPEGDGICFSLFDYPIDLTKEQEIEIFNWFDNLIPTLNHKRIAFETNLTI